VGSTEPQREMRTGDPGPGHPAGLSEHAPLSAAEKAALTGGTTYWQTSGAASLELAPLLASDGPNGVRGPRWGKVSMCVSSATALASTWNRDLVEQVGQVLGGEARRMGADILLAPTVNIHRHPLWGRSFEAFSEDPFLTSRMAVAYIRGVQSTGVACAVKHFVCNEQEFERMSIDIHIDERALREIYLPPFEASVQDAGVWSVMAAYNRVRGMYCSENAPLLRRLLKDEWGFDGVVVSDFFGTHSSHAIDAGLDLEMPGPPAWLGDHLLEAVHEGRVTQGAVDGAAERMLRLMRRTVEPRAVDPPVPIELVHHAAAEGMVLLRNTGLLPLDPAHLGTVAVIGPAAARLCVQGGGAAEVTPPSVRMPLEALAAACEGVEILHEPGCLIPGPIPIIGPEGLRTVGGEAGVEVEYFIGKEWRGDPVFREVMTQTRLIWSDLPHPALTGREASARLTAMFAPNETGTWDFGLTAIGTARVLIDDDVLLDNEEAPTGGSFYTLGTDELTAGLQLAEGREVRVVVEYRIDLEALPVAGVSLGARSRLPTGAMERAARAAGNADVAIVFVGTNDHTESESKDRFSLNLPGDQDLLVRSVAAANHRTVVVANTGAPIAMDWADEVAGILQVWYPGQEGGAAISDVLLGKTDASGRLPTTFPKRIEDTPAFRTFPGQDGRARYEESIFVGYRHYDREGPEPLFPFGHGLSFTSFDYRDLSVELLGDGVDLSLEVTNTGGRTGATVVQVYVRRPESSIIRADRELKAFEKVFLEPGESSRVSLALPLDAFRHWSLEERTWRIESGPAEILVGESSRNIRLTSRIDLIPTAPQTDQSLAATDRTSTQPDEDHAG